MMDAWFRPAGLCVRVTDMQTHSNFREDEPQHSGPRGECAPRGYGFLRRRGRVGSPPASSCR